MTEILLTGSLILNLIKTNEFALSMRSNRFTLFILKTVKIDRIFACIVAFVMRIYMQTILVSNRRLLNLCMLGKFSCLLSSDDFYIIDFRNILSGISPECQLNSLGQNKVRRSVGP